MTHITIYKAIFLYIAIISLLSIIATITDKGFAVIRFRRISEATLMLLALLGGSLAMYLTMILIRHKTRRLKFMLGLPLIIIIQTATIFSIWYFKENFGLI